MTFFVLGKKEMAVLIHPVVQAEVVRHIENCDTCQACDTCRVRNCRTLALIIETQLPFGAPNEPVPAPR